MNICKNSLCKINYPHYHVSDRRVPASWSATIDDRAVPAPWPNSLRWKNWRWWESYEEHIREKESYYHLFKFGWFSSHSGFQLPWKVDCESGLRDSDWEALASIIAGKFSFRSVYGIPKGGVKLADALQRYCEPEYPVLIVDDVLTTGRSFINARAALGNPEDIVGVVVFARGRCPDWVWPICQVSEWAQSRGTGIG